MSSSEGHRPASVRSSHSNRVPGMLERATDLEHQLAALPKSSEEKAAGLRSHLCEVLSDILISDPLVGMDSDCTGRLWRNCFYTPIGNWRSRISREKRKHGPNLTSLEQSFKKFLGEAITLYDYLVAQYQSKLLPSRSQEDSQQTTQTVSLDGVVPGLFRLYIHMGDLHRYSESFNRAEGCYLNASKLAPGMGNPYNQLAVVAQLKDSNMSCVALYWYARSLFATHDSFETSTSNLDRLYRLNRAYLDEHSRDSAPPVLPPTQKKASSEMVRAQKAAVSRSCLAHFVDFHYELFKNEKTDNETRSMLEQRRSGISLSFESLLKASGFSDSLLCKMVVISTFAHELSKQRGNAVNVEVSKSWLFVLGFHLSCKVEHSLSKALEKSSKGMPTMRVLTPLAFACEYFEQLGRDETDSKPELEFWEQLAKVATQVQQLAIRMEGGTGTPDASDCVLKDYQMLKGYRPFSFLHPEYRSRDPFVGSTEAVEALDLSMSQSQESSTVQSNGEAKGKVSRFARLLDRCCRNEDIPLVSRDGVVSFLQRQGTAGGPSEVISPNNKETEAVNNMQVSDNDVDEAGDVVLFEGYQGAVEVNSDQTDKSEAKENTDGHFAAGLMQPTSGGMVVEGTKPLVPNAAPRMEAPTMPPPPGITPPPGFGSLQGMAMIANSSTLPAPMPQYGYSSVGVPQVLPSHPVHPGMSVTPGMLGPPAANIGVLGQAMDVFGNPSNLHTANPFFTPTLGSQGIQRPMYESETPPVDGESLLGSGLLDSLLMKDGTSGMATNNPFANN